MNIHPIIDNILSIIHRFEAAHDNSFDLDCADSDSGDDDGDSAVDSTGYPPIFSGCNYNCTYAYVE